MLPRGEHNAEERLRHLVVWLAALNIVLLVALALGSLAYVRLTKEAERQRQELAELRAQAASLASRIDSVAMRTLRRQEEVDTLIAEALVQQERALRKQVDAIIAEVDFLDQRVDCIISYLNYGFPRWC